MVSGVHVELAKIRLLEQMLNAGPDVPKRFRGDRNWLLVRDGSVEHEQLLSLVFLGCVVRGQCALKGFRRFHATCVGAEFIGLNPQEVDRAVRCSGVRAYCGQCRGGVLGDQ